MKNQIRLSLCVCLLTALELGAAPALQARQDPSAAPAPAEKKTDEAKAAPAATATAPAPASAGKTAPGDSATAPSTASASAQDEEKGDQDKAPAEPPAPAPKPKEHRHGGGRHDFRHSGNERVGFWQDNSLAAGESADAVVSIFGSSSSAGEVANAVVSVFGDSRVTGGSVGDAAVSVLGNTQVENCTIGNAAVSVLGTTSVNGHVRGDVVAVLGNVELGPEAVVDGGIVCVGGEVKRDAGAVVHGPIQNVAMEGHHLGFAWLQTWFTKCLFYARPLAFDAHVTWAWLLALTVLGFYALVALVVPDSVNRCVQTLEQRPGSSLLAAVLTLLLTPVVCLLLVFTLALAIGFVLLPLFVTGLFLAGLFGRLVMLAWLGRRLQKLFGATDAATPVAGVVVGGILVLLLYTVPILGFIVYKLIGVLGLGVVIYTLILQSKANRAAKAAALAAAAPVNPVVVATPVPSASGGEPVPPLIMPSARQPATVPVLISAATLPRAGFWIRLAASFIDMILVAMTAAFIHIGPGFMLLLVGYVIVMWATKGTTIGGIICGLKVVRLDDRPVDWSIAIIRALGGFLSLIVGGLGFMWVAFDDDRQSWHDKIAGTTIVCVPKGTPLL